MDGYGVMMKEGSIDACRQMRRKRVLSCSIWFCLIQMVVSEIIPRHRRPAEKTYTHTHTPPHQIKMGSRHCCFVEVHMRQTLSLSLSLYPPVIYLYTSFHSYPSSELPDSLCGSMSGRWWFCVCVIFFCKCKPGKLSEQVFGEHKTNLTSGT